MDAMRGYLEKLGGNFLVAAMIPSLGFVIAVLTIFDPILNISGNYRLGTGVYSLFDNIWLLLTIPTAIVGFTLTALNTYVLKLYEGYVFLPNFSWLKKTQQKKARRLLFKREQLQKKINFIRQQTQNIRTRERLERLEQKHYAVSAKYDGLYPPSPDDVLPTDFGNRLCASESYPGARYNMDGVVFWARLMHVIPPSYRSMIESARNELSFLVNLSLLSVLFSLLCILVVVYIILSPLLSVFSLQTIPYTFSYQYVLLGALGAFLGLFFQKASLYAVDEFGTAIRSSYDLFRLDLLRQFHLKNLPEDSTQEQIIWGNLTNWIVLGPNLSLEKPRPLEYEDLTQLKKSEKEN
jgi:hypothetical protein